MKNNASDFCTTLDALPLPKAVNAIHQALMQLNAYENGIENLDNKQAISDLTSCLRDAGHMGFTE